MSVPGFTSTSRLMLIAPHPDDESVACGVVLQGAVRSGAAIRVVYVTDGDDNPWPQRFLELKWRLNSVDRTRWGRLRRVEALEALGVLGVDTSNACFLALPDQKLTRLLLHDTESTLEQLNRVILEWSPTHLLIPSISDTHPDHNALGVMLRLIQERGFLSGREASVTSYAVHGKSRAFFDRARPGRQSAIETATKLQAIRCHRTQLRLSRRRFLRYASRPERFLKLNGREATLPDGSIVSAAREEQSLRVELQISPKPMHRTESTLFILGEGYEGALHSVGLKLPVGHTQLKMLDHSEGQQVGVARYHGMPLAGELTIPIDIFSSERALFIKLSRRSWFFDEAGWIEIPPTGCESVAALKKEQPCCQSEMRV